MKLQKLAVILAALTIAGGLFGLTFAVVSQAGTIQDQGQTINAQGETIGTLATNSDALRDQVKDSGETPVAPPADAVTDAPRNGVDGISIKGDPGRPPTAAEVASSVAIYCTIRLDCTGAAGAVGPASLVPGPKGDTGAAGADSTVPGDTGAAGADSKVPGPTGLTGTGIASILCKDDGYWLFTLTQPDGTTTTQTVAGPCRVDPIITPTQGVTP